MKTVVSIDIGGTNLRVGVVDEKLNIINVLREPTTKEDNSLLYNQIKRMLSEVLNTLPEGTSLPKTCGVSACGLVSNNHIDNLVNLHILDFDLKGLLENDFPFLKVYIANDANCAAFSEATLGSAKNYSTSFFMTVST